jgi:UDP-N-acetylglucosamine--N-acetylmuramyl-(pentapeptide) pyrophosphoryl-undecaprenol N-acetylglucosamine transferase
MLWPQTELNNSNLVSLLQSWLSDKTPIAHMAQRARSCAIDDAAEQVVAVCRNVIGLK